MKQFKDFGISTESKGFVGDKIKIHKIFGKEIVVHKYAIKDSKYEDGNDKCLHLQISIGDKKHVIFTGSNSLMESIQMVEKTDFPFMTKIIEQDERFEFT